MTVKITNGSQAEREEWDRIDAEIREATRQYFEEQTTALLAKIEAWLVEWLTSKLKDGTLPSEAHP